MENIENFLGKNIKKYRKIRELTQAELAEILEIDFKYLSRLETGIASPSLKTIDKISKALNVSFSQLFDFTELKSKEYLQEELFRKIATFPIEKLNLLYNLLTVVENS